MHSVRPTIAALVAVLLACALLCAPPGEFHFAVVGDRTGETVAGVYPQIWQELANEHPAFAIAVGDSIQGAEDGQAEAQWREVERIWARYRAIPLYLTPGNHDIWSPLSERLFAQRAGHPPRYSFDKGAAHFTVLDNSRTEELAPEELAFLEEDLKAHATAPLKFITMHRPSWILAVAMRNSDFPLHRLARRYGVQYVIAGHIHQMLRFDLDGVTYVSMASAGGHLRANREYASGWFFGHGLVSVKDGAVAAFEIHEAQAPHGQGRTTSLSDWGMLGLEAKRQ